MSGLFCDLLISLYLSLTGHRAHLWALGPVSSVSWWVDTQLVMEASDKMPEEISLNVKKKKTQSITDSRIRFRPMLPLFVFFFFAPPWKPHIVRAWDKTICQTGCIVVTTGILSFASPSIIIMDAPSAQHYSCREAHYCNAASITDEEGRVFTVWWSLTHTHRRSVAASRADTMKL